MNIVKLSGVLGMDPKVSYNTKGTCLTHMSVAENQVVNNEKITKWHFVSAVGKLAEEIGNSVSKGSRIQIKGVYDNYKDSNNNTISYVRATGYKILEKGDILNQNEVVISGNVGKDPELKISKNGASVAWLSIAENRTINGEQSIKWHSVCTLGAVAEDIAKNVKKGQLIKIEGKYESTKTQDGKINSFVRAQKYQILEKRKEEKTEENTKQEANLAKKSAKPKNTFKKKTDKKEELER